jgi:hypothetical protein
LHEVAAKIMAHALFMFALVSLCQMLSRLASDPTFMSLSKRPMVPFQWLLGGVPMGGGIPPVLRYNMSCWSSVSVSFMLSGIVGGSGLPCLIIMPFQHPRSHLIMAICPSNKAWSIIGTGRLSARATLVCATPVPLLGANPAGLYMPL